MFVFFNLSLVHVIYFFIFNDKHTWEHEWNASRGPLCHLVMIQKKCELQLCYIALLNSRYKRIFMQQAYFIQLLPNSHTVRSTVKIPYFQGLIPSFFVESSFNLRDNLADSWWSGHIWQSNHNKILFFSWEYNFGWSKLVKILKYNGLWIMGKWPCYGEEKVAIKFIFSV